MNVRRTALYFVLLALIAVHAHADDEEGAEDTGEDGGDEDGEDEEELSHRNSLTWGRIFVEGGVQHRQFFKARFGDDLPFEAMECAVAEPVIGCTAPKNDVSGKLVFVDRGNCTWATKARNMEKAGAAAVAVISNDEALTHLPGPDGRDVTVGTVHVTNTFGLQMKEAMKRQSVKARLIPIFCEKESGTSVCLPVTEEERAAHVVTEGGEFEVGDSKLDFLTAKFGLPVPAGSLTLAHADPANACGGELKNAADVKGKAVVFARGGCPFLDKARAVSKAGGHAAIMINNKPSLLRMDSLKRYEAYDILTSMVMVGTQHGEMLIAAAKAGKKGTFTRTGLQASTWQQLRNDVMAEQWSLDEKERYEMFKKLHKEHASSPDRINFLVSAFKKADPRADTFLAKFSKGDEL